ncbi:MAG: hypothetical protein Kow0069_02120 [Promethearchaeota archaeon]
MTAELPSIEEVFSSKGRSKIIKLLVLNGEMNISDIVKKTRLNHQGVLRHLEFLCKHHIVQEKRFGRIRIFRLRVENLKTRSLKKLIEFWEDT